MKSGNFTCSKAPLKLETSIYLYIVLKTAVDLCTHAHVDIIVWELGYSSLVGSAEESASELYKKKNLNSFTGNAEVIQAQPVNNSNSNKKACIK